tara:strand:+ start:4928 stop:5950 length:1023 start_codon:yes stop_codon:yes gene_type:complete
MMDSQTNHVMVVMPSWVGDVVMATPALRLLRSQFKQSRITAVTRPGLSSLLCGLTTIDDCLEVDPKGLLGLLKAGRLLAANRPDQTVLLPNSMRSALLTFLSRAGKRSGFRRQGRGFILTQAIEPGTREAGIRTTLDEYIQLIEGCTDATFSGSRTPELAVTEVERTAAGEILPLEGDGFVVMVPGANRLDKRWPADRFARVAERLAHEHGLRIAVTGSPAEAPLVKEIVDEAQCPIIDLASKGGGLGALKAILQAACLVITNDTGPRHVAAALGTPVVSLFGPTDHRWTILPGIAEHRLLAEPFLPDVMTADKCTQVCRIDRITVEDVASAAESLLASD